MSKDDPIRAVWDYARGHYLRIAEVPGPTWRELVDAPACGVSESAIHEAHAGPNCMHSTKDTNPKDAIGTAKVPFSTVPAQVVAEVGLAMLEGAAKYGRHNFRAAGVRASVYYDAAFRHLGAWWEGQDTDPDSGLPHIVKAMACLAVLRDSQIQGNWVDDRPPKTPGDWVKDLNERAKALLEKYPNPVPAFTEKP